MRRGRDSLIGMPATRFLGPARGSLHLFLHRLGPGAGPRPPAHRRHCAAASVEHLGVFTEVVDDADVAPGAACWARKDAKMPADGIVMAKEAVGLVEQLQAYQGEAVASYLFHPFDTDVQFEDGKFNFVGARTPYGTRQAFRLRDARYELPEPN